ncbi:MAG: FAD binding domain-containing protein [Planctomycetota bacterium]
MSGPCEVLAPFEIEEAVQLLAEIGEPVTVLAGGTDLMPAILSGERRPAAVVLDLGRMAILREIREEGDELVLGAAVTAAALGADPEVARVAGPLVAAARSFGSLEIANRATIGGNVMTAGAAGDLATALLALDAVAVLASTEGRRRVPVFSLLVGGGRTSAKPSELLVEIRLPRAGASGRGWFRKVSGRGGRGWAKVNLACFARDGSEGPEEVRIALGGAASGPTRLRETERILTGSRLDEACLARALRGIDGEITPEDDLVSSAAYRRTIAARLVRWVLAELARPEGLR